MTLKQAKATVKDFHPRLTLRWKTEYQEYEVSVKGLPDAGYFTNDRQDAVDTARRMADNLKTMPQIFQ